MKLLLKDFTLTETQIKIKDGILVPLTVYQYSDYRVYECGGSWRISMRVNGVWEFVCYTSSRAKGINSISWAIGAKNDSPHTTSKQRLLDHNAFYKR